MGRNFWSRREFFTRTALAGLTLRQAAAKAGVTTQATSAGGPYIDVHTHIGRTWNGDPPLTADALLKWMDEHHVAKAVVLLLVSPESSS
jgi:uncharacterized protein